MPENCTQKNHEGETSMTDTAIESEIQAKGLTAPRVTPSDIEANVLSEHYFTAADGATHTAAVNVGLDGSGTDKALPTYALRLLTLCVLVLKNGFTITGESACASPENFDAELGRKIARGNAVAKIWPLMGYALKSKLQGE
jgi:Phage protein (N4 Gp49/phage Sf6 gene 66) family